MKLRLARKICKAIVAEEAGRYTGAQRWRASNRNERTRSSRLAAEFWHKLMTEFGVRGRAELLAGTGAAGMAFDLLMRTPEEKWTYGTRTVELEEKK